MTNELSVADALHRFRPSRAQHMQGTDRNYEVFAKSLKVGQDHVVYVYLVAQLHKRRPVN